MSSPDPLRLPLQLVNGRLATVPRDSDEDIAQALTAIARHTPGSRWDHPTMGVQPLDHLEEQDIDPDQVAAAVREHEQRVDLGGSLVRQALDDAAYELRLQWRRANGLNLDA